MSRARLFWHSTIGKKIVMGVTGLIMIAFLLTHVVANLLVFLGPAAINRYHALLYGLPELLWLARVVLIIAVVLHIIAAVQLTLIDRAARPAPYERREPQASTLASRTMRIGGLVILAFLVFHLLHFTTGTIQPVAFSETNVYGNVVGAFHVWWVVVVYVVAMVAVGLHLYHGTWSSVRTLGLQHPSPRPLDRPVAGTIAILIWLGFTVIPVLIFLGVGG